MVWYVTGRSHAIGLSAAAAGLYVGHCNLCYVPSGGEWCRHTHTHTPQSPIFRVPATNRAYKGSNTTGIARISPTLKLFLTGRQERIARNAVKYPCDFPIFVGICVNLKPAFFPVQAVATQRPSSVFPTLTSRSSAVSCVPN